MIQLYIYISDSFPLLLLLSRFSRVRLCDPIDGSPPGSSVPGIFQARVLEWVAIAFSYITLSTEFKLSWLSFTSQYWAERKKKFFVTKTKVESLSWVVCSLLVSAGLAKSLQSCLTLCDPRDSRPPGCPVPGIFQARTLEWVAISFSNAWKWKVKVKSLSRVWQYWA